MVEAQHVQRAFDVIRRRGIEPNRPSTKWDVLDPDTGERFAPKAVLRIARELASDNTAPRGGGPETNDPLRALGFEIALKSDLESSDEAVDIQDVLKSNRDTTTKERLVNARIGQGGFREALIEHWAGKCALTGVSVTAVLRASHIKAWRDSNDHERLDPSNGLLLVANIDALFDRYLLTFEDDGQLLVCSTLERSVLKAMGLQTASRIRLTTGNGAYLTHHRAKFTQQNGLAYRF